MPVLTVRPEVLEYGSIPIASWLPRLDSHAALQTLAHQLGQVAKRDDSGRYMVDLTVLARTMEVPYQHAEVLVDMLEAVAHEHQDITRTPQGLSEPDAVDFHAVMIFLFAQLYVRQAQRPEAMEVWPQSQVQSTQGAMRHVAAMHADQPASPRGLASHAAAAVTATNGPPVHHQLPLGSFSSPTSSHPEPSSSGSSGLHHHHSSASGGSSPTHDEADVGGGSPRASFEKLGSPRLGRLSPSMMGGPPLPHSHSHAHPGLMGSPPGSPSRGRSPSPTRSSLSSAGAGYFQHGRSNALVRTELHLHLKQHQQLLHGYSDYICRSFPAILSLALNQPPPPGSSHREQVSAEEFERLSLLLRLGHRKAGEPDGSPMDEGNSSFTDHWRLCRHVPMLNGNEGHSTAVNTLADWLSACAHEDAPSSSTTHMDTDMTGAAPIPNGRLRDVLPAGVSHGEVTEIQGVVKSTVARGEDEFPVGIVRISDCHDTAIYVLAPLQYAAISCCSDCTIVVGAVGRLLRVEQCERVSIIAAGKRICIAGCHDCIFYLGINHHPLLLGDNRFVQLAPYNTQYERLTAHMAAAGVQPTPNLWDAPVSLAREHRAAAPDSHSSPRGDSMAPAGASHVRQVNLLPPDRLLPFMVPFKGGWGPLCGGPATSFSGRTSPDAGNLVGLGESISPQAALPPSPFPLPGPYEAAKERKVQSVSDLRDSIREVLLDEGRKRELQSTIQAYFRDWLVQTGAMRQVYDLARMERGGDGGGTP